MNEKMLETIATDLLIQQKKVPPELFGHESKPYMKEFVKELIRTYEDNILRYQNLERIGYLSLPK